MDLKGLAFGFFLSLFPLIILARIFKGKFLFVSNRFLKGALLGFLLWLLIALIFYIDAVSGLLGILGTEGGAAFFLTHTSSLQGFITAGIVAGVFSKKL